MSCQDKKFIVSQYIISKFQTLQMQDNNLTIYNSAYLQICFCLLIYVFLKERAF